ncbi:hypothetical protein DL769_003801 [Monosporascus sp. CRB-8-3]|nr:hypothetical protein DL769_003801 [Monosporascus sp. CRB-8-3]
MTSEGSTFPWRLPSTDRPWPKHVEWACGHVTNLERGSIVKVPEAVPGAFYDPVRHCATCRIETTGDKLGSKTQTARVAINVARYGYEMLENLACTARKLERGRKRARAQELLYEEEARRRAAREAATWSGPLAERLSWETGDRLAQMAWHAELSLHWDANARVQFGVKVRNSLEEQLEGLRSIVQRRELWLASSGEDSGGFVDDPDDESGRAFVNQVEADALFIEWLLDEHANLIRYLEVVCRETDTSFRAISAHTSALVRLRGK